MTPRPPSFREAALRGAVLALSLSFLACAFFQGDRAPRHGWQAERGPVVPHESFPLDCSACHLSGSWNELRPDFEYDHLAQAGLELEGAHADAQCLRCHNDKGPVGNFARRGCAGCHEDVHRGQLGKTCEDCHGQDDWAPIGQIALHDRTRFPLVGAHAATACWRCHPGADVGNFNRTSAECEDCHQDDLARAVNPDHAMLGFTTNCDDCHLPTTWTGSGFTHGTWPLTGAHASADCLDCHVGGVFVGTPTACVDCHLAEYNATTSPDHAASMFPTTCEACHGTSSWFGAVFAHSFPINSGDHATLSCNACHTVPTNYSVFSCLTCHEHNQADTDDDHDRVPGYVYDSAACFLCHPTGN